MNENGKLDEDDATAISKMLSYIYDFCPYIERDEWWMDCFYTIIGDTSCDAFLDPADLLEIQNYVQYKNSSITYCIYKYNPYDTDLYWQELELQNYNY